jgi:hypothetical protein
MINDFSQPHFCFFFIFLIALFNNLQINFTISISVDLIFSMFFWEDELHLGLLLIRVYRCCWMLRKYSHEFNEDLSLILDGWNGWIENDHEMGLRDIQGNVVDSFYDYWGKVKKFVFLVFLSMNFDASAPILMSELSKLPFPFLTCEFFILIGRN